MRQSSVLKSPILNCQRDYRIKIRFQSQVAERRFIWLLNLSIKSHIVQKPISGH